MNEFFVSIYGLFMGTTNDEWMSLSYDPSFCLVNGLCVLLIPMLVLTIYYYVVNSVRFSKWYHWLILVLIICVINSLIAFGTSWQVEAGTRIAVSLVNVVLTFIVSFVWSLIIKWGSYTCRRTPF